MPPQIPGPRRSYTSIHTGTRVRRARRSLPTRSIDHGLYQEPYQNCPSTLIEQRSFSYLELPCMVRVHPRSLPQQYSAIQDTCPTISPVQTSAVSVPIKEPSLQESSQNYLSQEQVELLQSIASQISRFATTSGESTTEEIPLLDKTPDFSTSRDSR